MLKTVQEARALRKLWGGFQASRALIAANSLGVFEVLHTPKTARAAASALRTDPRATEVLLNALTGLGLVRKSKNLFRLSPMSRRLLSKGSPYYQGNIIAHAETLWRNWSGLDEVVMTGKPNRRAHDHNSFIMGMHNLAVLKSKEVVEEIGMKGVREALDIGGGPGTYALEMSKKGAAVTLFDFPETVKIAKRNLKGKKINYIEGDFLSDPLGGPYDLVFISQILHAYPPKDCLFLLRKAKRSLRPSGRVVVQEFFIEKDMAFPPQSALFSVNMLVATEGGRCYPPNEIKGLLKKAGFKKTSQKRMEDTVLVFGAL